MCANCVASVRESTGCTCAQHCLALRVQQRTHVAESTIVDMTGPGICTCLYCLPVLSAYTSISFQVPECQWADLSTKPTAGEHINARLLSPSQFDMYIVIDLMQNITLSCDSSRSSLNRFQTFRSMFQTVTSRLGRPPSRVTSIPVHCLFLLLGFVYQSYSFISIRFSEKDVSSMLADVGRSCSCPLSPS